MAQLVFHVASDWEEVVKLRTEIAKLKQELKSMDSTQSPVAFKTLNTQLSASTQRMDELVTNAAKAGAVMEGDFKKKIFDASQTVNGFMEKIIAQKNAVGSLQSTIRKNKELYKTIVSRGGEDKELLNHIREQEKALGKERDSLFRLTQQQAEARLSVKKLRDEYALYRQEGSGNVDVTKQIEQAMSNMGKKLLGGYSIKEFLSSMIRVRGEFQAADTAIQTLLGSKEKADALMRQVREYAKISPLEFSDVTAATQMMLGFNIEAEKVPRYLQAIGDVSMGNTQRFNSLTLAFSQMSATGKLMGQDMNQMINAGFNPLQAIADKTGKSIEVLKDEMSKGAISAEMVQQAFIDATSAGGKFYNMSENASKTINGQISMMHDALDAVFNELGTKGEGVIIKVIQMTTSLIENYETVGKILAGLVITYGTYRTAVMLVTAAESKHTLVEMGLTNARILARKAQLALNAAMLTNPYVLLATAVVGLGAAMWAFHDSATEAEKAQKRFNEQQEKAAKQEQEHKQRIDSLVDSSRDIALADLQRGQSLAELRKEYPKIFAKYDIETIKLADILKLKRQIAEEDEKRAGEKRAKEFSDIEAEIKYYENLLKSLSGQQGTDGYVRKLKELRAMRDVMLQDKGKGISEQFISSLKDLDISEFDRYISELEKRIKGVDGKVKLRLPIDAKGSLSDEAIYDVKDIKTLIDTAKSTKQTRIDAAKNKTTYKQDYEKAKKEWEDAKKKLSEIEKDKSKFTSKQYEEAKKREETAEKAYKKLGGVTGGKLTKEENQAEKLRQQQEKYNLLLDKQSLDRIRREEDLENQAAQARIDAMSDGFIKEQTQRDLNNKKEIQALERQKEDYIRTVIQAEREKFNANPANKGNTFNDSSVKVDTSGWDTIINDTKTKQGLNEWEQREASMNEYLLKYGTFTQKKEALDKKYRNAIDKEGDLGKKNILQKEWEEAVSSLDMDKLKQEINWELVFGDLSKVSKKSLEQVKSQLKAFKDSAEYQNMTVEQKKVVDEALNNIQSTIIDKGGLLGDLPEQLDALRVAQEELAKAQEEYDKALENGTDAEKEAALKKKNNAEKNVQNAQTNVTKSADKTTENLISLADTITQLGSSSEMTLSQIGNLASGLIDTFTEAGSKIGGIVGAAFSLLDAIDKQGLDGFVKNIFSSVFNTSRSVWDTITFGAFSKITGSGDSDKTLEQDIEYLTQSNQDLKNALDNLSEKMDKASVADASDIYSVQKENILKLEANTREAMQRSGAAYSNGFMGIGGSHSTNYKIDKGMSASEWKRVSDIVGRSVQNASQFFQLSSEQMAKLAEDDTALYSKIKSLADDGYKDAAQYMDEYITYYKQLEELENAYNEKLTNTSFDSVRDSFKSALLDMKSDAKSFTDDFEKMMQNAIIESLMTKKYDKLIQDWYEEFAKAMENDGKIDKNEQGNLKNKWDDIVNKALAERDALKEAMGWRSDSDSTREASQKGIATASQDSVDENNGRLTVIQEHTYSINENVNRVATGIDTIATHAVNLSCLTNIDKTMQSILSMRDASLTHLSNIDSHTSRLEAIEASLASVKNGIDTLNTKGITIKR